MDLVEKNENRSIIEQIAAEALNAEVRIKFQLLAEDKKQGVKAAAPKKKTPAEHDPLVQDALKIFDGRVVETDEADISGSRRRRAAENSIYFFYTFIKTRIFTCNAAEILLLYYPFTSMSKNLLNNLMKQAQQMQERVKKLQEEAGSKTVEASAGGGMVTVVANGRQEVLSIKIDPSVVDPKDIEMLQDLILAAINEALRKSQELMKEEMARLTAGMGLPRG